MDAYIARQPILKKNMKIYGYELLFRSNSVEKVFSDTDADQATSRVVMESFYSRGLSSITGGKPAFINFTSRLLQENTATLFPKDQLVIEILEDVEPTLEIVAACRDLQQKGYTLAMDDFIYRPDYEPLIKLSKIIKFDFLLCTPQEIEDMMRQINLKGKLLLAEKIETFEMFDLAVKLGFSLFQGYFFSKPVTLSAKALSPLKINYVNLLNEISSEDCLDYRKLAMAIRNDVALSYKLLKLVNSAYYSLRVVVNDIAQAITILGTIEIRKWVLMIALMGLSSDKPDEIIKMSMIRGRFLENLNTKSIRAHSNDSVFQTGLFSMLDVLMDMTMVSALDGISLSGEVRTALIEHTGVLYDLLELATSLERSDWVRVDELTSSLRVDAELVSGEYLDAVKWCNELNI